MDMLVKQRVSLTFLSKEPLTRDQILGAVNPDVMQNAQVESAHQLEHVAPPSDKVAPIPVRNSVLEKQNYEKTPGAVHIDPGTSGETKPFTPSGEVQKVPGEPKTSVHSPQDQKPEPVK